MKTTSFQLMVTQNISGIETLPLLATFLCFPPFLDASFWKPPCVDLMSPLQRPSNEIRISIFCLEIGLHVIKISQKNVHMRSDDLGTKLRSTIRIDN